MVRVASTLLTEIGNTEPSGTFLKTTEEESSARMTETSPATPTNKAQQVTERSTESFGVMEKPLRAGLVRAVS